MDDLISRQDAIKATLEFIVEYLGGAFDIELQSELKKRLEQLPPAQPQDKVLLDKEAIIQAGYQGKEVEFYIGGRLFAIREKAQ